MVESDRVSVEVPLDPVGGVHTIEMIDGPDPWFKLEIGSDPDEIENHEPIGNVLD